MVEQNAPSTTLMDLADSWGFTEEDGVAHVVACQDYACPDCAVIACATDLRAAAAEMGAR